MTQTDILQELLNWTRVGFYSEVKTMLSDVLNTDTKRIAYQMADGATSRDTIKSAATMGSDSISTLFQQCVNLGLIEVTEDNKRRRLFDLSNFGLLPQIETMKKKSTDGGKQ